MKLRRAKKHLEELRQAVVGFAESVQLSLEPISSENGRTKWMLAFDRPIPDDLPMMMGDAIHNMRASLDIMVCDIARLQGKSTDKLKFPFAESAEKLEVILAKDISRLGPDVVEAIRELQPYKNGNEPLRGLHDLDIDDKHETVLPNYIANMTAVNFGGIRMGGMGPLSLDSVITWPDDQNPWDALTPTPGGTVPTFPVGLPFPYQPVVEVLESLSHVVEEIIEGFARKFGNRDDVAHVPPSGENGSV